MGSVNSMIRRNDGCLSPRINKALTIGASLLVPYHPYLISPPFGWPLPNVRGLPFHEVGVFLTVSLLPPLLQDCQHFHSHAGDLLLCNLSSWKHLTWILDGSLPAFKGGKNSFYLGKDSGKGSPMAIAGAMGVRT